MPPELSTCRTDELSHRPGSALNASRIRLAKTSPLIVTLATAVGVDHVEQFGRVEAGAGQGDHAATLVHGHERAEQAGAVHVRAG